VQAVLPPAFPVALGGYFKLAGGYTLLPFIGQRQFGWRVFSGVGAFDIHNFF